MGDKKNDSGKLSDKRQFLGKLWAYPGDQITYKVTSWFLKTIENTNYLNISATILSPINDKYDKEMEIILKSKNKEKTYLLPLNHISHSADIKLDDNWKNEHELIIRLPNDAPFLQINCPIYYSNIPEGLTQDLKIANNNLIKNGEE